MLVFKVGASEVVPDCGHETVPSAVSVAVSGSGTHADMQKTFRAKKKNKNKNTRGVQQYRPFLKSNIPFKKIETSLSAGRFTHSASFRTRGNNRSGVVNSWV